MAFGAGPSRALWAPVEGAERPFRTLSDSTAGLLHARISPDGRWVAGTFGSIPDVQVYVQSLEGPPGRWQISATNARRPVWTKGGKELVYEGMDGRLMAVDIDTKAGFHAGTPKPLFPLPHALVQPQRRELVVRRERRALPPDHARAHALERAAASKS